MTQIQAQHQVKQPNQLVGNGGEDELFVKRPVFNRVRAKKPTKCHKTVATDSFPAFPTGEEEIDDSLPGGKRLLIHFYF